MAEDVWLPPTAQVIGNVVLGREESIWFSAIVRGDNEPIVIGDRTNVQDGCVLHSDPGAPLRITMRMASVSRCSGYAGTISIEAL